MKTDKAFQQAAECMPPLLRMQLEGMEEQTEIEELRLRAGRPPGVKAALEERVLDLEPLSAETLRDILSRAARFSVHSYAESLRYGYITLAGGHRLGVCGTAVVENGEVSGIRNISSLNLRVARQIRDAGEGLELVSDGRLHSTLLISPPGLGKTTLLRELIRRTSDAGWTVGVADERCEIAALSEGVPQFDVGRCTDVIEGCSKQQAALMLLKTMSPALIALDEITSPGDVQAVGLCAHCGVSVVASAHAKDLEDLRRRALYRELLALHLFERVIIVSLDGEKRTYQVEDIKEESEC